MGLKKKDPGYLFCVLAPIQVQPPQCLILALNFCPWLTGPCAIQMCKAQTTRIEKSLSAAKKNLNPED